MRDFLKPASSTILVEFGITGDLARRLLLPALLKLYDSGGLSTRFAVVGFSRRNWTHLDFRREVQKILSHQKHKKGIKAFLKMFFFQEGYFHDPKSYKMLSRRLDEIDRKWGICTNKIFHLAVPPGYYPSILKNLAKNHLTDK